MPSFGGVKLAADGTFRVTGLKPGKARLYLATYPPPANLSLVRVERDGVPQKEIEIAPGANISGVRVFFEYGSGRIRGLVTIVNGPLPDGARLLVGARRRADEAAKPFAGHGAEVDSRGQFIIEGLPPGEYEVSINPAYNSPPTRKLPTVKQTITVVNDSTSEAAITFDLNAMTEGAQP